MKPESQASDRKGVVFSLTAGGPFYELITRLRLRTRSSMRRCWSLAIFAWLPLVISEGIRALRGMPVDPMVLDLSMHARFLIALPLMLSSELVLEQASRSGITSIYAGNYCDRAALDRIVERVERLRDSWVVEALLLALAIVGGQLVLWDVFGATGWIHGETGGERYWFPHAWYAIVALPLVQFVMFRWLWRWVLWSYALARIALLPLTPLATHPDYACGLSCLARPISGYSGFVIACSSVLSAAWGTQVLEHHTPIKELVPGLVAFLLTVTAIGVVPLIWFSGHLFRVRRKTLAQYGDFSRSYMLQFHRKWVQPPNDAKTPLGTPDIQSLNDLGSAFQVIAKTRVFVFGPRNVLAIWFSGLIPMVPLFASSIPLEHVLKKIITTVLGGLPF